MDFIKWSSPDPGFIREVYRLIEEHPDEVKAEGPDYLRGQLNFFNRRDFRVETALNLLERWDAIERVNRSFEIKIKGELPEEYLDVEAAAQKLRRQNEKLLELVEWTRVQSCRATAIYSYFGSDLAETADTNESQACGRCDYCESEKPES